MSKLDQIIAKHWAYVEGVLSTCGVPRPEIERIGYHYRTAFAHGWKHAKVDR